MHHVESARIIIVEDHTLLRELLQDALHRHGHTHVVATAGTVEEAVVACMEHPADMLIIGWQLPDGTGLELVRRLGARVASMRILMLTSSEQEGIVRNAAENGVHGFVSQRQSLGTLREAILALLAGKCYYCPTSSKMLIEAMKNPSANNASALTPREWQILRTLAEGLSTKEMARRLHLSPKTVSNHITSLKDKLGIQEPAGLVRFAVRQGLVQIN